MAMRTITLTDRPPVRVDEENWGLIASASDRDHDGEVECQAFRRSKWSISVRQHDDGRTIVYAIYHYSTAWREERDLHVAKGVLLPVNSSNESICNAIKTICKDMASCEHHGEEASRWRALSDECIADMPAEELG